jgi:hypothetical protein
VADEWLRLQALSASIVDAPLPLWLQIDDLDSALDDLVARKLPESVLGSSGISMVIDGLDERTDRGPTIVRQATEFVARWPKSSIVLTSRAPEKLDPALLVPASELAPEESTMLMEAVAGRRLKDIGSQLWQAATRPLFAILIAQHASRTDGVTGIAELIDLVVDDVVHNESGDLYPQLRRLAVETLRSGGPVDPTRFTDTSIAANMRNSSLIVSTGRRCAFSLATFEQWFAARALLEGEVSVAELLTSLAVFERWKYVLAIVLAAGEPAAADDVIAEVMEWNPGPQLG